MAKGTVNKVILLGRLGSDPEVRYMPNGNPVANLRLATNDGYKDRQSGQFVEQTEWHRVILFGRMAEIAGQYLTKGSQVYIEGRIRTNKWQDQSGQDRFTTEIVANEMQLMGGGQAQAGAAQGQGNMQRAQPNQGFSAQRKPESAMPVAENFEADFSDDEIPF